MRKRVAVFLGSLAFVAICHADDWNDQLSVPVSHITPEVNSPDKYPSLGLSAQYSPLTGSNIASAVRLKFTEMRFDTDFRVPVSEEVTMNLGLGFRSIDYGHDAQVSGATYSAGMRFFFK